MDSVRVCRSSGWKLCRFILRLLCIDSKLERLSGVKLKWNNHTAPLYLYAVNRYNLIKGEGLCFLIGKQQWGLSESKLLNVDRSSERSQMFYLILSRFVVHNMSFFTKNHTVFTLFALKTKKDPKKRHLNTNPESEIWHFFVLALPRIAVSRTPTFTVSAPSHSWRNMGIGQIKQASKFLISFCKKKVLTGAFMFTVAIPCVCVP